MKFCLICNGEVMRYNNMGRYVCCRCKPSKEKRKEDKRLDVCELIQKNHDKFDDRIYLEE